MLLRIDGRLENADFPTDAKHPLTLPARNALTRLIVLAEHAKAGHSGSFYTLINTRQRFDNSWDRKRKTLSLKLRKMLNTKS